MQGKQADDHAPLISEWKATANKYGRGLEEDLMEFPGEYPVRVAMHKYTLRGVFMIPDADGGFLFANPATTIGVRILKTKAHINRFIRSVEENFDATPSLPEPVWPFLTRSMKQFREQQPGIEHDITMEGMSAGPMESYATQIRQSQELAVACGISSTKRQNKGEDWDEVAFHLMFRTPVHTVCPFILHETRPDEEHTGPSHTQRAYIQVEMWAANPPRFSPILREINTRLQPCQSGMKIPDEAVQVLRAYSAPTYTEDAVFRVLKIIRGIKDQVVPEGGTLKTKVYIVSQESIFQNDMTSEAEDVIE